MTFGYNAAANHFAYLEHTSSIGMVTIPAYDNLRKQVGWTLLAERKRTGKLNSVATAGA